MSGRGQEVIAQHLSEAIERLQKDIEQVEVWAIALNCFAQPIPDYEPDDRYRLSLKADRERAAD
jgi:hypothetical protein